VNREKIFQTLDQFLDQFKATPDFEDEFNRFKTNFRKSEIVTAFPGAFFFIGEHAVMYGQPALYMPIPLYVFVGIKKSEVIGINVETWQLDQESKLFKKHRWEDNQIEEIQSCIREVFRRESVEPRYNIFVLMQVPPRCGLNSSGAFSAGVSVILGMLKSYISEEKVNVWQKTPDLSDLKKDKEFNKIFEIAWEIDHTIQNGSSGIGPFASLIGVRDEPIVYFLVENEEKTKREWFACLLSKLYGEDEMDWLKDAPIALIYSEKTALTREAFKIFKSRTYNASETIPLFSKYLLYKQPEIFKKIKEIATPLRSVLISNIKRKKEQYKKTAKINIDELIEELEKEKKEYKISDYILSRVYSVLGGFSLICISNFKRSSNKEYVTNMMNVYQWVLDSLNLSTPEINEICRTFQKEKGIGAKLTGSGCGGDVVVFSHEPDKIGEIEKTIKKDEYIVHYKSWDMKKELYEPIQKFEKYLVLPQHDLKEEEKTEAYIGVIAKRIPESPEYKGKGEFSKDAIETQENTLDDVKQIIKIARENNINLDVIVLPEYSLPPEKLDFHWDIRKGLLEIAKNNNLIIIGGSYLSKAFEDICLVFSPNYDEPFRVPKLNKSPMDPDFLKEGCGIQIFGNSRIGDFCVVICYDALSEEIFKRIREKYRRGKCFTLFILSYTPDIKSWKKRCEILALPLRKSQERYNSNLGLTAHVILADGYHGLSYYTAPVKSSHPRENICNPVVEKDYFYIYKILVEEMSKVRKPRLSNIFYTAYAASDNKDMQLANARPNLLR